MADAVEVMISVPFRLWGYTLASSAIPRGRCGRI